MTQTYTTKLVEKKQLAEDVYELRFEIAGAELNFIPGQYIVLFVPQIGKEDVRRLFSIASSYKQKNSFELLVKLIPGGIASEYLRKLNLNDTVMFWGPAGQFVLRQNPYPKVFLVTGTGIAPVMSMIRSEVLIFNTTPESPHTKASIFWGLRKKTDIYWFDELKKVNVVLCLSQEASLEGVPQEDRPFLRTGRVTSAFETSPDVEYYLCGNREVVEGLREYLTSKGIARERIIFEKF